MDDEYIRKADVLNLPQNIERNLRGEIVERSVDVGAIEALPSADVVQVVHARWENYSPITIKCSRCGHVIPDWRYSECKYCPKCGARMDGERKE